MKRTAKAEMTVFFSLVLLLVASLLFTLIEAVRLQAMRSAAEMDSLLETENVFAEYNAELLKEYGLLFLDDSYGSGKEDTAQLVSRICSLCEENLDPDMASGGSYFFRMKLTECTLDSYELATDRQGNAFRRQVVSYMEDNILKETADALYQRIQQGKSVEDSGTYSDGLVSDAGNAIATAKQEAEESEEEEPAPPDIEFENPLELFSLLKGNGILTMVLPDQGDLSAKQLDQPDPIGSRTLYSGTYETNDSFSVTENMLYLLYLNQKFSSFTESKGEHKLDYELEYILSGKSSDRENLEYVVNRLLLLREISNLVYLHTDGEKTGIADTIATVLAGASANPILILAVREGILAAWAYVESLQDVRTLLAGGKIPLVKTAATWSTDVLHPATSFKNNKGAVSENSGFSYSDYLLQFLFFQNKTETNYRTMEVIEQNLRMTENNQLFRMDCMMQRAKITYGYEGKPLFLSFVTVGKLEELTYRFSKTKYISYVET